MKKKVIAMLLCAVLATQPVSISVSASSETNEATEDQFIIHNSVLFEMSKDAVILAEKQNGFENEANENDNYVRVSDSVFGINDTNIVYNFSESDNLFLVKYIFNVNKAADSYEISCNDFKTVSNKLNSEYGNAMFNKENKKAFRLSEYKGSQFVVGISQVERSQEIFEGDDVGYSCSIVDYEQWLIKQKDSTYILLDHYIEEDVYDESKYYSHTLSYVLIDTETAENTMKNISSTDNNSSQYNEEGMNKDPEVIKSVQDSLNSLGYDCGVADGIAGGKTQKAIEQYQKDSGLNITGNITGELVESIAEKLKEKINSIQNSKGERDIAKIVSSIKSAASYNSVQVSEPIEQDGAVGYVILCNNSRFSMISNVRDDGKFAICLIPSEVDSNTNAAFNDYLDVQSYLIQAIDSTVDGYDARVYALKTYEDGTYIHNDIEYELYKDSMIFMAIY